MMGGILQDMGREPIEILFNGIVFGEESKQIMESIRSKFKTGDPLQFLSDITGIAEINQVLIQDFNFNEDQGFQSQYRYNIKIREYVEPPKDDDPPPDQEDEAQEEAEEEADDTLDEDVIEGTITDEEGRPVKGVTVIVSSTDGEWTERTITDEDGNYETESKFKPDSYTVSFEVDGFDKTEVETEIKSSKEK